MSGSRIRQKLKFQNSVGTFSLGGIVRTPLHGASLHIWSASSRPIAQGSKLRLNAARKVHGRLQHVARDTCTAAKRGYSRLGSGARF